MLQSGSTVITNIAQTIWVQNQPFVKWTSACSWGHGIKCKITRKACAINQVQQKIKMENAAAKSFKQIDKLIKRDWAYMRWNKDDKTNTRQSLSGFVKAGKVNKNKRTSYLARVIKYWGAQYRDRFARLYYYLFCSKTNNTVTDSPVSTIPVPAKPFRGG